jgi:phosphomethylpyrimidine synthase
VYVGGSRPDIQVPMREISQSDTPAGMGAEVNPPLFVYDTSGPYTDPTVMIDIRTGLKPLREAWIEERNDTERLGGPTSVYGQVRLDDPKLAELRFNLKRLPVDAARMGDSVSISVCVCVCVRLRAEAHENCASMNAWQILICEL